jgi:hypothetical protein
LERTPYSGRNVLRRTVQHDGGRRSGHVPRRRRLHRWRAGRVECPRTRTTHVRSRLTRHSRAKRQVLLGVAQTARYTSARPSGSSAPLPTAGDLLADNLRRYAYTVSKPRLLGYSRQEFCHQSHHPSRLAVPFRHRFEFRNGSGARIRTENLAVNSLTGFVPFSAYPSPAVPSGIHMSGPPSPIVPAHPC